MRKNFFDVQMFFLVLTEIWQSTRTTLFLRKWLNQPPAFSYKSGNLCPLKKIMIGMFSSVQYKTMKQLSVYFGQRSYPCSPFKKNPAYEFITPKKSS